jgi:hypothetical protein
LRTLRFNVTVICSIEVPVADATMVPCRLASTRFLNYQGLFLMKRFLLLPLFALAVVMAVPAGSASAQDTSHHPDVVYFDVTGHYVNGEFLEFWHQYGGIQTFGYPLTPVIEQDGLDVQYFERHVMEYHPDNPEEHRVLLRHLGVQAMEDRDLAQRWPFDPQEQDGSLRFFPETQQNLSARFNDYWHDNGGLRIFGFPISTQFRHHGTRVQFTERTVFEHHPDNPPEWQILFERLGAEAAERDGVDTSPQSPDGETPFYHEDLWEDPEPVAEPEPEPVSEPEPVVEQRPALPAELVIDRIGVRSTFEHLGRTPQGAMADPVGWDNVSWFNEGPRPGEVGNAAVAGHLDRPGGAPAAFWNLRQLAPGDRVTVITEDGERLVFEVTEIEQFHVNNAPTSKIFGRSDERNMNLITCAGNWDHSIGMYDQRLVAYTTLVE